MKADQLVKIKDTKFDTVFDDWVFNISRSIGQLHQNTYFSCSTYFYVIDDYGPDREYDIELIVKKTIKKHRNSDIETILVGYDTNYLEPTVLEAILTKIRAKKPYKDVRFSQITAAKITQSVDTLLYNDYYIPDLLFVVIEL